MRGSISKLLRKLAELQASGSDGKMDARKLYRSYKHTWPRLQGPVKTKRAIHGAIHMLLLKMREELASAQK